MIKNFKSTFWNTLRKHFEYTFMEDTILLSDAIAECMNTSPNRSPSDIACSLIRQWKKSNPNCKSKYFALVKKDCTQSVGMCTSTRSTNILDSICIDLRKNNSNVNIQDLIVCCGLTTESVSFENLLEFVTMVNKKCESKYHLFFCEL